MIDAATVHATLGADGWARVLRDCGVHESYLSNRHGPCPACGGKDRFRFANKGTGTHFCSQCGHGDGFKLLMKIGRCSFKDAFALVLKAASMDSEPEQNKPRAERPPDAPAQPTHRVRALMRESCAVENCDAAMVYLSSRSLWPLPKGCDLRAHPSVEYWFDHKSVGRFPALIAKVRDADSELVTLHVTYLTPTGEKLSAYEPRKILSAMTSRVGCAAQLVPAEDTLGLAEGIETALSATKLTGIPTWAALNATMLAKFEVGPEISKLVIFADRDIAGLEAASKLMQKLQERVTLDIRIPQAKDWNDVLRGQP